MATYLSRRSDNGAEIPTSIPGIQSNHEAVAVLETGINGGIKGVDSKAEMKKAPEQMSKAANESKSALAKLMAEFPMPIPFKVGSPSMVGASPLKNVTQVKNNKRMEGIAPVAF